MKMLNTFQINKARDIVKNVAKKGFLPYQCKSINKNFALAHNYLL